MPKFDGEVTSRNSPSFSRKEGEERETFSIRCRRPNQPMICSEENRLKGRGRAFFISIREEGKEKKGA